MKFVGFQNCSRYPRTCPVCRIKKRDVKEVWLLMVVYRDINMFGKQDEEI